MAGKSTPQTGASRRMRGFERADGLLSTRIREAGEGRGFAVTRLLTHWAEIAGADLAAVTRPVRIGYGRGSMGATLTLLTQGSHGPMVQAQLPSLKDRVNAVYGYAAVSAIKLTQTAPTGFAEGQAEFAPAPVRRAPTQPTKETQRAAREAASGVQDEALKAALEQLGTQVMSRTTK